MSEPNPLARFFGAILIAIGGLIALLSGLCTLFVGGAGLVSALQSPTRAGMGDSFVLMLIFGGAPFAIGLGLFFVGRSLWRGPRA